MDSRFRGNDGPVRNANDGPADGNDGGANQKAGKRYSWGYGACPDLDDHATVFKLLPAKEALGMDMTEAFQLMPEQSTAAIIIHHPEAKYYAVRGIAAEGASVRTTETAETAEVT